ncbi:hypothetical protein DY000_02046697 [Brassica cretica]|uniref:Uncharacterized protein n=1 Tax=Brassica cretica TaxID=69181 RepID=A0ABQ7EUW8_BRACR|nr:hypothetical protein DY000_02046697 [Brassica cretica]
MQSCTHRGLLQPCGVTSRHVTLASLNVSRLNFTSYHISGYVDMQFQVLNANLLTDFSYDDVYCSTENAVWPRPCSRPSFKEQLDTFIKWRFGSSSSKSVRVSCNEVPVGLVLTAPGHGMMIGPARMCKVF